jgi:uncharacterized protein YndB with AHSA1/START domain
MTTTRELIHEESFQRPQSVVFQLLHQPSAIRRWWAASHAIVIPQSGGVWTSVWGDDEDDPDYITSAAISVFEPPRRMVLSEFRYYARSGPLPFDAEFETEFVVTPEETGCRLTVTQRGFPLGPEADDYYAGCQTGWSDTFAGIRRFLSD